MFSHCVTFFIFLASKIVPSSIYYILFIFYRLFCSTTTTQTQLHTRAMFYFLLLLHIAASQLWLCFIFLPDKRLASILTCSSCSRGKQKGITSQRCYVFKIFARTKNWSLISFPLTKSSPMSNSDTSQRFGGILLLTHEHSNNLQMNGHLQTFLDGSQWIVGNNDKLYNS